MSDYHHRFHAGNVGDVLKHCALLASLDGMPARPRRLIDTHAGEGRAKLASSGEWTSGIGRLGPPDDGAGLVGAYLRQIQAVGVWKERLLVYPGSPLLMSAALEDGESMTCFELAPPVHEALARRLAVNPMTEAHCGDGLLALPELLAESSDETLVLIDPPYTRKAEWNEVSDAVVAAWQAAPEARQLLWYPIKRGRTRSSAMISRVREAGVACVVVELITTPLDSGTRKLNGSGVLMVNPAPGAVSRLAEALPTLGERCGGERWSSRVHRG